MFERVITTKFRVSPRFRKMKKIIKEGLKMENLLV